MGVVFDEVTATVQTQDSESSAPQETENEETVNPPDSLLRLIETQQRRAKRLWTD